ncbi:tripartite tricarboxylate transporter substrate binding protein [Albitalea terrae]|uniref:Tripartite tricarboxylate transporter substrate binding protein n=2 Tax=Piscinibacter terrae TaxID=2496871 RepID=A0A3N7HQW5_9BURK|nr:tripartite tricarboxylate transporter substrate binding protein [Albitalea terrae]RQP24648.1 tripartite tricarboxylate transporter substrate binding protein [Albitalea terrae]
MPLLAQAQAGYPRESIRLIVPFPPAGGTDVVSRMLADRLAANTGWVFVVENKAGAGGNIGLDAVAKSKPDGLTLGMGQTANLAINPTLYPKMPYDPLKDFTPVALVASQPVVLVVRAESPYKTLAALVAAGKAKPGAVTMASAGNGTVGHLAGEMFAKKAGAKFMHVPYKGAGPALTDLLGGQTDFFFITPQGGLPFIKSGKLRALAVTSAKRLPVLPDTPTVAESGYAGFEAADWKAVVAPVGTPPDVVKRLNAEVEKALAKPDTIARLLAEGSAPMGGSPQAMAAFLKAEQARWGAAVKEANVKLD